MGKSSSFFDTAFKELFRIEKMSHQRDYDFLKPKKPRSKVKPLLRIGIVPVPNFTLGALSDLVEFLRYAADERDYSQQIYCRWSLLSHNSDKILSSCGFEIIPTEDFCDPTAFDYVIILGGLLHSSIKIPNEIYDYITKVERAGIPLIGLGTGQFLLAELGLLNGRKCAVHFTNEMTLRKLFPEIIPVTDEPFIRDGQYITCSGGFSTLSLAIALVSEHCGNSRSRKALHYLMAGGDISEIHGSVAKIDMFEISCNDETVTAAISIMHQKSLEFTTIDEIAQKLGTNKRQLSRLFNKHLKMPPAEYWRNLRLKTARRAVLNTNNSIAQIAYECGFADSSHLVRWFKKYFDKTPTQMRRIHLDIGIS